jgi:hypothetical protein
MVRVGNWWRRWILGPCTGRPGGDLDVAALANKRVSNGTPLLADIYAAAAGIYAAAVGPR